MLTPQDALTCSGIQEICKSFRGDRKLRARRVSEAWLEAYLSVTEQAAVAALSVFAGSFNAAGAAAVLAEIGVFQLLWWFQGNTALVYRN